MAYCGGNPCERAQLLIDADASVTRDIASISEAGMRLIDNRSELASLYGSSERADIIVNERNRMNDKAYEEVSNARDFLREQLGKCATCMGMSDGVCPGTFDYSE